MINASDIKFQNRLKKWAGYLVLIVLLVAIAALAGWEFNIRAIIHPLGKLPPMNPVTAVIFALFAISFQLLTEKNSSKQNERAGRLLACLVVLIGGIKFFTYILKIDSGIDSFLFPEK